MGIIIAIPVIIVILLLAALIVKSCYIKSPPDIAKIITGARKESKYLIGKAGFKIPFFDRVDMLDLSLIPIDVKTSSEVPTGDYINVKVDAAVNVKIGTSKENLAKAAAHFLNKSPEEVGYIAREVLEGNMREIIGQMKLKEMVSDREKFNEMVKKNAAPDLESMGLEIVSFNVQKFTDQDDVIKNLGIDNIVAIQKNAAISRAKSEKEIASEKAKAAKEANDAKVEAEEAIAEKNAQLMLKKAELKQRTDMEQAKADTAKEIELENQRKILDVAATDADIAKAEREAELKKKQVELKEYELDALVRKQADAKKYAAEQEAEAERIKAQKSAEAKAYEMKVLAEAEKLAAEQKAVGIEAVGRAEAAAIREKAEAQKQMGEASVLELVLNAMPEMVAHAAAPLNNVDSIVMYGEGNQGKLVGDVMTTVNKVCAGMAENGIDIPSIIANAFNKTKSNVK